MTAAGGIMAGAAGPGRLFSPALGGQISWFLLLAVTGAVVTGWQFRRQRAALSVVALFAGWFALHAVVFSTGKGTFHAYYTAALAPGVAALAGLGLVGLVRLSRCHGAWLVPLAGVVAASALWQVNVSSQASGFYDWVRPVTIALTFAALAAFALAATTWLRMRAVFAGVTLGVVALVVAPAAWAASETANRTLNMTLPQAGPRQGVAGSSFGSRAFDGNAQLAAFLRAQREGETWDLVTANAQIASSYIADHGLSVMALGGFMGSDPSTTTAVVAQQVANGEVRYFLTASGGLASPPPSMEPCTTALAAARNSLRLVS